MGDVGAMTEEEALEAEAEARAERRREFDVEQVDAWGRTPDWTCPRGYAGDRSLPW